MKTHQYILLQILYWTTTHQVQCANNSSMTLRTSLRGGSLSSSSNSSSNSSSRRLSKSTTAWSNLLAFICPPHLKHCPKHETGDASAGTGGASKSASATKSSDTSSSSTAEGASSASASSSSSSSSSVSYSYTTDDNVSSSSTSASATTDDTTTTASAGDDSLGDTVGTSENLATDDTIVVEEKNNNSNGGIMNASTFGWMYIVGAALLVGGLALAVVGRKRSVRSKEIGEGSKTGLIDISSEDPVSVFVPMQSDDRIGNVLQGDIDDIIVEYGVKM